MPAYRHYRLDGDGAINKADWIEADSDEEAVRLIREMKLSVASELWDGPRRVVRIEAADRA